MHHVLYINEIAQFICNKLDESALASLARSCKVLHEPAIRSLWADLGNLVPLVKCLPPNAWTVEENEVVLTRLPHLEEWGSFLQHARLVRTLGIHDPHGLAYTRLTLSFEVIPSLCAVRPHVTLLPSLRSFKWSSLGLSAHQLPAFAYLTGSDVKQILISAPDLDAGHILTLFFAILAQRRSSLDYIGVFNLPNIHSNTLAASCALSYAVQASPRLTVFDCIHISLTEEAVNTLASLTTLKYCSLRLPETHLWRMARAVAHPFPSLTHINIACSMEAYAAFSSAMALPLITHLILAITSIPDSGALLAFLPSIRRQLSPTSLASIQIHLFDGLRHQVTEAAITAKGAILRSSHFSSLLDFGLLESFDLRLPCMHDIDDTLFASLAKAWPRLRTFVLGDQPYCIHSTPRTTLKALIPFALHCSHLEAIGLQLNAVPAPAGGRLPEADLYAELQGRCSTSRVELLHVSTSSVANAHAEEVAVFLSCVFPELRIVWASRSDKTREGQRRRKAWQKVDRFIRVMHRVRMDERRRWEGLRDHAVAAADARGMAYGGVQVGMGEPPSPARSSGKAGDPAGTDSDSDMDAEPSGSTNTL